MSLKMKWIIKNIVKIATLSFILSSCFFIINNFVGAIENDEIVIDDSNNINYKNITVKPIANVWVAITSNIWIWIKNDNKIEQKNINNKLFDVRDFYENKQSIKEEIIKNNMLFVQEYSNILRINFNDTLSKSKNKEKTLNNIIKQLEIRYTNSNNNIINLSKQRDILLSELEKISTKINNLKNNLEIDFTASKSSKVFKHVENYYDLKYKEISLKTNIIFIWEFIKRNIILNNYNKWLLDTLINNKDIISKNSFIVIPSSWSDLLKDFNLIFTEEEYKNK